MNAMIYELFLRKHGLRRVSQLMSPLVSSLDELLLPKYSILHFVGEPGQDGPDLSSSYFQANKRFIPILHRFELTETAGNPRKLPAQPGNWARSFRNANKRFRTATLPTQLGIDPLVPGVVNYSFIARRYKYVSGIMTQYNQWRNLFCTVLDGVNETAKETGLQQFLVLDLPKRLPSVSLLRQASKEFNISVMKKFPDAESLVLLEFWKWLGEHSKESLLSRIDLTQYNRVNIILRCNGHWSFFNLGVLFGFRAATASDIQRAEAASAESEEAIVLSAKGDAPLIIQKKWLRYCMALIARSLGSEELSAELDKELSDLPESKDETGLPENKEVGDTVRETVDAVAPEPEATVLKVTEVPTKDSSSVGTVGLVASSPLEQVAQTVAHLVKPNFTKPPQVMGAVDRSWDSLLDSVGVNEHEEHVSVSEEDLDKDLAALEVLEEASTTEEKLSSLGNLAGAARDSYVALINNDDATPEEKISQLAVRVAEEGGMTAAEYRRLEQLGKRYQEITFPGTNKTMAQLREFDKSQLKLKPATVHEAPRTVFDKSMLSSRLEVFDSQYMNEQYQTDLSNVILSVQNAGVCVAGVESERIEDATGTYDHYRIKLQPVEGAPSTVWMKLPVVGKDGTFSSGSVSYTCRKQRFDVPIRKVSPERVSLTSYYGKLTAERSNKKVTDYGFYLSNIVMSLGLDNEDDTVTELIPAPAYRSDVKAPRLYTILGMRMKSFKLAGYTWYLNYTERTRQFTEAESKDWEVDGALLVGKNAKGELLLMDKYDQLFAIKKAGVTYEKNPLPCIEALLGIDRRNVPQDIVSLKVLGKYIPIGFILSYYLGLERLINSLGISYRRVVKGGNLNLAEDEWRLVFGDESLVFSRKDRVASMLLAGLKDYHRELKKYSVYDFDKPDVYLNLLEAVGLSTRYLREIDLLFKMFVDPITKDVLEEMNEPTSFQGLLIRSVEMLQTDDHPDEIDPAWMRIRGFERIPGAVYGELVKSIRAQQSRVSKRTVPIEMNPYAVWRSITTDPAVMVVNEMNPIQNLKEVEAVTYGGNGGRSSRTMVKHTREYHRNDLGTMSEATVDSSDVGINVFLSADPKFQSVRGISARYDAEQDGAASILSTSSLLAPAASLDDARRVGFISVQNSHTVACKGYRTAPVRTGEEAVMVQRVGSSFASTAKGEGVVESVSENAITVKYKDGSSESVEIGRRYGAAAGLTIPHDLVANVKAGQKVKAGEVLCYNKGFFEKDSFSGGISYKGSLLANVMVYETSMTDEDSSVVSKRLARDLGTETTKIRDVVLDFDQSVRGLMKAGSSVDSTDVLCLIEDSVTAGLDMFDENSLDTLKLLGSQAPMAKVNGVIDRIEVYYHGDIEDMSESLKKITRESDRALVARCKSLDKKPYTGSVDEGFRSEGQSLKLDTLVIRFYISTENSFGGGDKLVYANQMKSVVGEIMDEPLLTENGTEVDVQFGRRSIFARIVNSPDLIGTTTTLLEVIGKKAFDIYNGKK